MPSVQESDAARVSSMVSRRQWAMVSNRLATAAARSEVTCQVPGPRLLPFFWKDNDSVAVGDHEVSVDCRRSRREASCVVDSHGAQTPVSAISRGWICKI